jgi:RNA polymerase primary sigma factor
MFHQEEYKSIQLYYDEAAKFPLLSKDEEIETFQIMHKWTNNKSNCGSNTRKKGIEAREKLINSNLRLVIKIAKEFMGSGLDLPDLINEGNTGLIKGVDKFKSGKGAKLSHYSSFWIRQCIMRALANQGRTIRLPQGAVQQKINIIKFKAEFETVHGRWPTTYEIAKNLKLSIDRVILLTQSSLTVASLNAPCKSPNSEESDAEVGDLVPDDSFSNPDQSAMVKNDNKLLYDCLDKLDERERYIIEKRFALEAPKSETLEVIGERFGVTRERVRQVEAQAMNKLKNLLTNKMK